MTENRKCSFYIYPERNAADNVAEGLLSRIPQKERGRAMRAMMLCGAALMKQDERLPYLISEFLTDTTSMNDIQKIISSTLPSEIREDDVARLLDALLTKRANNADLAFVGKKVNEATDENDIETRRNGQSMFPDI